MTTRRNFFRRALGAVAAASVPVKVAAEEPAPKCARCNDAGQVVYQLPPLPNGRSEFGFIPLFAGGGMVSAPCPECGDCSLCGNTRMVDYVDRQAALAELREYGVPAHLSSRPVRRRGGGVQVCLGPCPNCLPHEVDAAERYFAEVR